MAQNEFNTCPKCGIGKMKADRRSRIKQKSRHEQRETGFERDYK